jgi:hypothetical protein
MSVDYRLLRAADEHVAIAWWAGAYEDTPALITSAFRSDPQCFERSHTASGPDGALHAAVTFWIRMIRDAAGTPRRVAHLWGIGTPGDAADAARQVYIDNLMDLALRSARRERCELALFYPAPETHAHYQQRGWQLFPYLYRQGTYTGARLPTTATYTIRPYDPTKEPAGWTRLAEVYDAYNATRPATVVRDAAYWRDYLGWRWGEWFDHGVSTVLVATLAGDSETLCGYIIPKFYPDTFLIAELGVRPSDMPALSALLAAVMEETTRRSIAKRFRVYLPSQPDIDSWLHELFGTTMHEGSYGAHAVYPLEPGITPDALKAMFTAPGSHSWILDRF